jgi:hypothetical protein
LRAKEDEMRPCWRDAGLTKKGADLADSALPEVQALVDRVGGEKCIECGGELGELDNVGSHTNRDTCVRVLRRVISDLRYSLDSACEFCQDRCKCKRPG